MAAKRAVDMEFVLFVRLVKFWLVVASAVDKELTLVLVRLLSVVNVELVVDMELAKEITLATIWLLREVMVELAIDIEPVTLVESEFRLFVRVFSAVVARVVSVARFVVKVM
jgi:hypothetical protein